MNPTTAIAIFVSIYLLLRPLHVYKVSLIIDIDIDFWLQAPLKILTFLHM